MSGGLSPQERQAMKKLRKRRKRKRAFVVICFLLCCAGITVFIFRAPFFNLKSVKIEGNSILSQKQIRSSSGVSDGENIFLISMSKTKERVEKIPYVKSAEVKRVFPDSIRIKIKECVPRAYVAYKEKYVLLDYNGKILEISKTNDKYNVMTVKGIKLKNAKVGEKVKDSEDKRIKYLTETLEILEKNKLTEKVREVDFTRITAVKINYDNRIYINCGSYDGYDNFKYKLDMCRHIIAKEISPYEKVEIDLTLDETVVRPYLTEEEKKAKAEEADKENAENAGNSDNKGADGANREESKSENGSSGNKSTEENTKNNEDKTENTENGGKTDEQA